jgi:hypothetical protein
MTTRNRELSQFGSFIYVENSTQEIGITTSDLPYVGIGTTNPQYKLDVNGDTNVGGSVYSTGYYLNGNPLVSAEVSTWTISGVDVYRSNGNVGIGTTIPAEKLDVIGSIKTSNINIIGVSTASRFISTVSTGTAPFEVSSQTQVANLNADFIRGKTPPSGDIVGSSDNQILTNKTINLANNSLTGTISLFNTALSDADFATLTGTEVLTNKTLVSPGIGTISNGGNQTIPTGTGSIISTNSVGLVTTGMIADGTITNADISASAAIAISKLASSTISGVSLGSTLSNLTAGSFVTYSSGTTYNGSAAITIGVAGTTANTANTLISRNASGDFTAGTIACANLNATFTVTAADINSTSDVTLKTNIHTVDNALETIDNLRGVSFDWKQSGKSSYGVIAQELEKVLPELVASGEVKSVNYNGIIGILIEAVKELKKEVEDLKTNK